MVLSAFGRSAISLADIDMELKNETEVDSNLATGK